MDIHYLVVDLDDTLVRSDTLFDLLAKCLRRRPCLIFGLAVILLRSGRSHLKRALSDHIELDVSSLPYRWDIVDLCRRFRDADRSRQILLASASDQSLVKAVAEHLQIFDDVLGSQPGTLLKGQEKLRAIQARIGGQRFAYAGDSRADLPIWKESAHAILVNPSAQMLHQVRAARVSHEIIRDRAAAWRLLLRQLRPHQWIKNLLLLVPFLAAHRMLDPDLWRRALVAFASFSCLASAVYILNDVLDIEADRQHATKKNRPFAAGHLSLAFGFLAFPALLMLAFGLACFLPYGFALLGLGYLLLNLLYSFKLKECMILDVVILGSFYTIRILSGGLATEVNVSTWLLSFSTFFFFGLAMVKRYTEIAQMKVATAHLSGRSYRASDALAIGVLGVGSSLLALLVLAVYFNSPDVRVLYENAKNMWLLVPLLLYWTARLWLLAFRGEVHDDPVIFALRDRASWVVGGFFLLLLALGA